MIIEYKKPLFLKKKIVDTNILMDKNFTINIDFKVEEGHKKDDKIGFFGILAFFNILFSSIFPFIVI